MLNFSLDPSLHMLLQVTLTRLHLDTEGFPYVVHYGTRTTGCSCLRISARASAKTADLPGFADLNIKTLETQTPPAGTSGQREMTKEVHFSQGDLRQPRRFLPPEQFS